VSALSLAITHRRSPGVTYTLQHSLFHVKQRTIIGILGQPRPRLSALEGSMLHGARRPMSGLRRDSDLLEQTMSLLRGRGDDDTYKPTLRTQTTQAYALVLSSSPLVLLVNLSFSRASFPLQRLRCKTMTSSSVETAHQRLRPSTLLRSFGNLRDLLHHTWLLR
jgi:hypothetical protein